MNYQEFKKIVKVKETQHPNHIEYEADFTVKVSYKESYMPRSMLGKDQVRLCIEERILKELYWNIWGKEKRDLLLKVRELEDELTKLEYSGDKFINITELFLRFGIKSELLK